MFPCHGGSGQARHIWKVCKQGKQESRSGAQLGTEGPSASRQPAQGQGVEVQSCHVEPRRRTRTGLEHAFSSWKSPRHAKVLLHARRAEGAALCGDTAAGLCLPLQFPESLLPVPGHFPAPRHSQLSCSVPAALPVPALVQAGPSPPPASPEEARQYFPCPWGIIVSQLLVPGNLFQP